MKIVSPLAHKKARLEIIPLIDIMFFLLASFMLVSLSMTKQRTVSVNLPAVATAQTNFKPDNVSIAVNASGQPFIEKQPIALDALEALLGERLKTNKNLPVFISGDAATPHGAMIAVLDHVRRCGATKVAFSIKPPASEP